MSYFWLLPRVSLLACTVLVSCSTAVTPPGDINAKYSAILNQRHNHYRLKPGDAISISFYDEAEDPLNQEEALILPDGRADLYYLHDVRISGMTVREFETEVKEHVREELKRELKEVRVQVIPAEAQVHMVGEFARPASIPLTTKMTVSDAVSAVGGLRVTGDTDWALLWRPYLNPTRPDRFRFNLNDDSEALYLLPGDSVVLNRTFAAGLVNYLREYIFSLLTPVAGAASSAAIAF